MAQSLALCGWRNPFLWGAGLILGGWLALEGAEFLLVERPTTPMTVELACQLFERGPRPGASSEEVEAWLMHRGIFPVSHPSKRRVRYGIHCREEGARLEDRWMDARGSKTVAELAGLDAKEVHSYLRVEYPDAARTLVSQTEIRTYYFFDANDRMLRYWIGEIIYGP